MGGDDDGDDGEDIIIMYVGLDVLILVVSRKD